MINDAQYKRALADILEAIVTVMNQPTITITKATIIANPAGYTGKTYALNVDDYYYAAINKAVTIGGKTYTVIETDDTVGANVLTVNDSTGTNPTPAGTFQLYKVYFFHGTPMETADDIGEIKQAENKFPMVWLWENFKETYNHDPMDAIERAIPVRLFFLDERDKRLGSADVLLDNCIKPMMRLRDYFIEYLKADYSDFDIWDMKSTDQYYGKFGVYMAGKGVQESMFADNLTGVESDINLKIRKPGVDWQHSQMN